TTLFHTGPGFIGSIHKSPINSSSKSSPFGLFTATFATATFFFTAPAVTAERRSARNNLTASTCSSIVTSIPCAIFARRVLMMVVTSAVAMGDFLGWVGGGATGEELFDPRRSATLRGAWGGGSC